MSSQLITTPVSLKGISLRDYTEQQSRHCRGEQLMWDGLKPNKTYRAKVGDFFAFVFNDCVGRPGYAEFHRIIAVHSPSMRLASWAENIGQSDRPVVYLSPMVCSMPSTDFCALGGTKSSRGTQRFAKCEQEHEKMMHCINFKIRAYQTAASHVQRAYRQMMSSRTRQQEKIHLIICDLSQSKTMVSYDTAVPKASGTLQSAPLKEDADISADEIGNTVESGKGRPIRLTPVNAHQYINCPIHFKSRGKPCVNRIKEVSNTGKSVRIDCPDLGNSLEIMNRKVIVFPQTDGDTTASATVQPESREPALSPHGSMSEILQSRESLSSCTTAPHSIDTWPPPPNPQKCVSSVDDPPRVSNSNTGGSRESPPTSHISTVYTRFQNLLNYFNT